MVVAVAAGVVGCRPARESHALQRCEDRCRHHASSCDEDACVRGCRTVSDREVEGLGKAVFQCVHAANDCSERAFARCAVRQGVHADGGPPVPASYPDDD